MAEFTSETIKTFEDIKLFESLKPLNQRLPESSIKIFLKIEPKKIQTLSLSQC